MVDWWKNRRVLVTGQTGFKGSWLCLWLGLRGAQVTAAALPPDTSPSLYEKAVPWSGQDHHVLDIRDCDAVCKLLAKAEPEVVFHLAGQALVRRSYKEPVETYATNLMGTVHVMEAIRQVSSVKAALMITTDKVYENREIGAAFREEDRLGGRDPYSNSKACAELAVQAYRESFFAEKGSVVLASVRAGNVVGGGDWAEDRLIPDIVRAYNQNQSLNIRYPNSIRPWQHVLDALHGYMIFARKLVEQPASVPYALNFGPDTGSFMTVQQVVETFSKAFDRDMMQTLDTSPQPHEAQMLMLDTQLAQSSLGWQPQLNVDEAIHWTAEWYKNYEDGGDARALTLAQIQKYEALISGARKDAA